MIREANLAAVQVEVEPIELETPKQSFRTSAFRASRRPTIEEKSPAFAPLAENLFAVSRSEKVFASAIVARKAWSSPKEDLERKLAQLMKSAPIRAVMAAARSLATETNCSENQAAQDILASMSELSQVWEQLLTREGLERLSDPV